MSTKRTTYSLFHPLASIVIACEHAGACAYLHRTTYIEIILRDCESLHRKSSCEIARAICESKKSCCEIGYLRDCESKKCGINIECGIYIEMILRARICEIARAKSRGCTRKRKRAREKETVRERLRGHETTKRRAYVCVCVCIS